MAAERGEEQLWREPQGPCWPGGLLAGGTQIYSEQTSDADPASTGTRTLPGSGAGGFQLSQTQFQIPFCLNLPSAFTVTYALDSLQS